VGIVRIEERSSMSQNGRKLVISLDIEELGKEIARAYAEADDDRMNWATMPTIVTVKARKAAEEESKITGLPIPKAFTGKSKHAILLP
jgi:hypothetical protein